MEFIEQEAKEDTPAPRKSVTVAANGRYVTKDRQWDARFVSIGEESDQRIVQAATAGFESGRLRYVLVGGPEIGQNPKQDDYGQRHVHLCLIFNNPLARSTILNMFNIKKGFYLVPRNRTLPYSGWRNHHTKQDTKCDITKLLLYENGELPADNNRKFTLRSDEEKKRKVDEVCIEIRDMLVAKKTEKEIFDMFPRNWLQYGEKIKGMLVQQKDFLKASGEPHIWLYGSAGTGKSSLFGYIYPHAYTKNLYNRFFDLYDPRNHDHVLLEDLDFAAVESLSLNFIKTLCDESGFTYDQKYKSAQPARTTVLVTSQFDIASILNGLDKQVGIAQQGNALRRRFWEIQVKDFHRILGIKIRTPYELRMLKQDGNMDPGKCFMGWDYVLNMPSMEGMPSAEECRARIEKAYYKK